VRPRLGKEWVLAHLGRAGVMCPFLSILTLDLIDAY